MSNLEMESMSQEAQQAMIVQKIEQLLASDNETDKKMVIAVVQNYVMPRMVADGFIKDDMEYMTSGHSARFREMWNQVESNGNAFGVNEIERMRTEGVENRLKEIYQKFISSHTASSEQMAA